MKRLLAFSLALAFILSCSKKRESSSNSFVYASSGEDEELMTCSLFSNDKFEGYAWSNPEEQGCFYFKITYAPRKLFEDPLVELHFFPIKMGSAENGTYETLYELGPPALVQIISEETQQKVLEKDVFNKAMFSSMGGGTYGLFDNYFFKACINQGAYEGFLIEHAKRIEKQKETIITTEFIIPPLPVDAKKFSEDKGYSLGLLHPLNEYARQSIDDPEIFKKEAKNLCN